MSENERSSMDIEKRMLLAIALSMVILIVAPYLMKRFYPSPAQPAKPAVTRQQPAVKPAERPAEKSLEAEKAATPAVQSAPVAATEAKPRTVQVENENLILRWNNTGATLESALLKNLGKSGESLELVAQNLPSTLPRPFQLRLEDAELDKTITKTPYSVDGPEGQVIKAPAEITFELSKGAVHVVRKVKIPATGYLIEVETHVRENGRSIPYSLFLGPGVGASGYQTIGDFADPKVAYSHEGSVVRYRSSDLDDGPVSLEVPARWIAMDSQYFAYGILDDSDVRSFRLKKSDLFQADPKSKESTRVPVLTALVALQRDSNFRVFFGPKDNELLRKVDPNLASLVDYGWFSVIVKPLLFVLKLIYAFIGNYGWAIIILTFFINLALFPVRFKQMVSMKKMADLQPKMRSIQDRYKRLKRDDPKRQQMNVEIMALYKEHGVNPLGGCLPLLIQMPFLFAFYRMLASSFELRGAPFGLWIHDLSAHDPYYITPIVMGITMVIQQKMTPAAGDPAQRRMMMMMPVVMTFFFLNVSSGLAVYFLFSNVFGMMFQLVMQKFRPDLVTAPKAAAK